MAKTSLHTHTDVAHLPGITYAFLLELLLLLCLYVSYIC